MVKVGRYLSDGTWKVTQGINSISAAAISNLNLTARNLGSLSANGTPDGEISGSIYSSAFTLTGDDGTSRHYGLRTVRATGTVLSSDFSVKAGNVDRVTVGRFLYSNLYLNYTPGGAFNMTGSFNSTTQHKLNRFSTTATTIGDPNNSSNFAFADSEIVADTIGTVRLSGVQTKNFGTAFGIKFRTSATSVQVKSADSVAIPFNTNLTPSGTALANEFFYLDV
jgi:hypothetical protein